MSKGRGGTRREFVQLMGAAIAAGSAMSCTSSKHSWRCLSSTEARTLRALCAQIIPEDDAPGAVSAGVVNYIDLQLSGVFKRWRRAYRDGLKAMDRATVAQYGTRFAELAYDQQLEFLTAIDREPAWDGSNLQRFFHLVVSHTMQGFYGDPRHGGNVNRVSWKMVGLPYPPVRGQDRYGEPPKLQGR